MNEKEYQNHQKVCDAVDNLRKTLEATGLSDVVVIYGYRHNDMKFVGSSCANGLTALGVAEQFKINSMIDDMATRAEVDYRGNGNGGSMS